MSTLGLGAMLGILGGNQETVTAFQSALGKVIASAAIDPEGDGALVLRFEDGSGLEIFDAGRSCCESRYITCDDDLGALVGGKFLNVVVKDGPEAAGDYDVHETAFVEVESSLGSVTLTTHNEHNGYYGGFYLRLKPLTAQRIEARSDETLQAAQPEGQEPDGEADAPEGGIS